MRKLSAIALLLLLVPLRTAVALEARDVRGLQLEFESIDEPVQVDGVALRLRAARGPDVPRLAARVEQRWRAEGSAVQRTGSGTWQLLARLDDGRNEVIQWRGAGTGAQLLHSVMDVTEDPAAVAAAPFRLPARCAWLRVIDGAAGREVFEQRTATCAMSAGAVLAALRGVLEAGGWSVERAGADAIRASRVGAAGLLRVLPGERHDRSTLAWLLTGTSPASARRR